MNRVKSNGFCLAVFGRPPCDILTNARAPAYPSHKDTLQDGRPYKKGKRSCFKGHQTSRPKVVIAVVHHGRLDPGVQLISKPFTFEQLAARVRDMLDRRPVDAK